VIGLLTTYFWQWPEQSFWTPVAALNKWPCSLAGKTTHLLSLVFGNWFASSWSHLINVSPRQACVHEFRHFHKIAATDYVNSSSKYHNVTVITNYSQRHRILGLITITARRISNDEERYRHCSKLRQPQNDTNTTIITKYTSVTHINQSTFNTSENVNVSRILGHSVISSLQGCVSWLQRSYKLTITTQLAYEYLYITWWCYAARSIRSSSVITIIQPVSFLSSQESCLILFSITLSVEYSFWLRFIL